MKSVGSIVHGFKEKFYSKRSEKHVNDFKNEADAVIIDEGEDDLNFDKVDQESSLQGVDPTAKIYYESFTQNEGQIIWTHVPPKQISKKQAARLDRIGIKVYKIKDADKPILNGRWQLIHHKIELQNLSLVAALKPILRKEGVYLDENDVATFMYPFRPLYFCSQEISDLHAATPDSSPLKLHLLLLLKIMGEIFSGVRTQVSNLQKSGLITYKLAWVYFRRGVIVYVPGQDTDRLLEVVDCNYETKPEHFAVTCREVVFDGTNFTYDQIEAAIVPFSGNKPITKLLAYPLSFHSDPEAIKAKLAKRGKKVLDYQGLSYAMYTGIGYHDLGDKKIEKYNVDGRILIDTYGYQKYHQALSRKAGKGNTDPDYPVIDSVEDKDPDLELDEKKSSDKTRRVRDTESDSDSYSDYGFGSEESEHLGHPNQAINPTTINAEIQAQTANAEDGTYVKRLSPAAIQKNKNIMLSRNKDLIYINPLMKGYDLKNKVWLRFYVDDLRSMEWNVDAYDHLVYPDEQKDLVYSFVEQHCSNKSSPTSHGGNTSPTETTGFVDVIKGKGAGLVMLLSGPPGTGKTLTAEAVADKTHRPLLYMHAEDLGVNPATLGANLKKMFAMAVDWNAICLLDECDVFLAARNPVDIQRNELCSIFLREIEYFQGILFLTTNLYETIDSAFRSRVSMHLRFDPLKPEAREILWRKFLDRMPPMKRVSKKKDATTTQEDEDGEGDAKEAEFVAPTSLLSNEDVKELSMWELNGREIKQVIKTVKCWADVKKFDLDLSKMEAGVKVTAPNAHKRGRAGEMSLYDD